MTDDELHIASRDAREMEAARTWDELDAICRTIEARHSVEGIADIDRAAYENVKAQHARRVIRSMVA